MRQARELLPAAGRVQQAEAERQDQNLMPSEWIAAIDPVPVRAIRNYLDDVASTVQRHDGFGDPVCDHVGKHGWNRAMPW
jgi:hypothetical protein